MAEPHQLSLTQPITDERDETTNARLLQARLSDPGFLLTTFLTAVAIQGLLELLMTFPVSIGGFAFGNKVLRLGLYSYILLLGLWRLRNRRRLSIVAQREMALIQFLYAELFGVLVLGFFLFIANRTSGSAFEEFRQLLEVYILIPMVYSSIGNITQIRKAIDWLMNLLTILAFLSILGYLSWFMLSIRLPFLARLFSIVLLFGAVVAWGRVLVFGVNLRRLLLLVILVSGSLITFQKPVMLCGIIGLLAVLLLLLANRGFGREPTVSRHLVLARLLLVLLILALLFLILNDMTSSRLVQRYQYEFDVRYLKTTTGKEIDGQRLLIWDKTWNDVFLKSPWVGTGWGVRVDVYYADDVYIHNFFLYWLASTGVVGGLVLALLLFIAGRYVLKNVDLRQDVDLKMGLLGYIVVLLVYNSVGVMFAEPALTYVAGVVIGLVLRIATLDAEKRRQSDFEMA